MHFDHERLDVYRLALDFLVYADGLIRRLPRGRAHFADQLGRSALSVVLNIAEGAGKVSAGDKRRYYLTARGSATEAAALLDALSRVGLLDDPKRTEGKEMHLPHRLDAGEACSQPGDLGDRGLKAAKRERQRRVGRPGSFARASRNAWRSS
jgi:four helix bundle protein